MQANGLTVKKLIEIRGDVLRFDDPPINMKPGHLRKMQRGLYNVARVMDFNFKFVERRADLEKEAKLEKERKALKTKRDERDEDENHMLLNSTAESQVAVVENEYWDNQEDYHGVGGSDASEGYYDEQGEWVENDHYVQSQYYGEEGEGDGEGEEQEEQGAEVEQELQVANSGKEIPTDRVPETTTDNALKTDITTSASAMVDAADVVPSQASKENGTSTKQQLLLVSTTDGTTIKKEEEVASNNTTVPDATHAQRVPSAQVDVSEPVEIEGTVQVEEEVETEEIEEKEETRTEAEKKKESNNNQEEEKEEEKEEVEEEDEGEEEEEEEDSDDDAPLPNGI
jgi:hypothetical protein